MAKKSRPFLTKKNKIFYLIHSARLLHTFRFLFRNRRSQLLRCDSCCRFSKRSLSSVSHNRILFYTVFSFFLPLSFYTYIIASSGILSTLFRIFFNFFLLGRRKIFLFFRNFAIDFCGGLWYNFSIRLRLSTLVSLN